MSFQVIKLESLFIFRNFAKSGFRLLSASPLAFDKEVNVFCTLIIQEKI